MLDTFLKVAYGHSVQEEENARTVELLKLLPNEELAKLASGQPSDIFGKTSSDCENTFLAKFQGTPLFEQAVALEQEELQAEMADLAQRQQRRMEDKGDKLWDIKDGIRVKKKLLELELAKASLGAAVGNTPAPGATPAQGSGALGEVAPEGASDGVPGAMSGKIAALGPTAERIGQLLSGSKAKALSATAAHHAANPIEGNSFNVLQKHFEGLANKEKAKVWGTRGFAGAAVGGAGYGAYRSLKPAEPKVEGEKISSLASFADNLGRQMARAELEKSARAQAILEMGDAAGKLLAKQAFDEATPAKERPSGTPYVAGGAVLGGTAGGLALGHAFGKHAPAVAKEIFDNVHNHPHFAGDSLKDITRFGTKVLRGTGGAVGGAAGAAGGALAGYGLHRFMNRGAPGPQELAKQAFAFAGAGNALKGVGQAALGFAKQHPGAVAGGAIGAVGGGIAGAQNGGGISGGVGGALGGGVGGAVLGAGAQGTARRMGQGMDLSRALKGTAQSGLTQTQNYVNSL